MMVAAEVVILEEEEAAVARPGREVTGQCEGSEWESHFAKAKQQQTAAAAATTITTNVGVGEKLGHEPNRKSTLVCGLVHAHL